VGKGKGCHKSRNPWVDGQDPYLALRRGEGSKGKKGLRGPKKGREGSGFQRKMKPVSATSVLSLGGPEGHTELAFKLRRRRRPS